MTLLVHYSITAPTSIDIHSLNDTLFEDASPSEKNSSNSPLATNSSTISLMKNTNFSTTSNNTTNDTNINLDEIHKDKEQLRISPSNLKSNLKARKNNNDLYFCCTDDTIESLSFPRRKNKDREKNTKSPVLKLSKAPEEEEPYMERRPALLLRFFPDGTAVLISKFQLHLHVKPKQIKFEPDGGSEDETLELNPIILNDEKSYEVAYKRLEAIPSSREQNEFDLDESEEREAYSKDLNTPDHEFITTPVTSTNGNNGTPSDNKLLPVLENTLSSNKTDEKSYMTMIATKNESKTNQSGTLLPIIGDSPFFMMSDEEMSSLQKQYEPAIASPLQTTASLSSANKSNEPETSKFISTTSLLQTTHVTPSNHTTNTSTNTTTKCLSFKNQLSLALSTEDNIDNALLKRHVFPTLDCDSSSSARNPFANLKKSVDGTTVTPSALPIITRLYPEPTTTPSYTRSNFVPYLNSQFSNHPTNPDIFVVTSLPMSVDLKSSRNHPITIAPAWREVTVGVVRDQKGQPLKPRYNNWEVYLRGMRKKTENKFWNDYTTPKPSLRSHSREPLKQNIQQSSSQISKAFWNDLQKQHHMSGQRHPDRINNHMYLTNPPRDYPFSNENKIQFWRIRTPNAESGWNTNSNSNTAKYSRIAEPYRSSHANYGNAEVSL